MIIFKHSPDDAGAPLRTVRPIVVIQSDDWGRVGIPSPGTLEQLKSRGLPVGDSKWDYYGLETESDVAELGSLLSSFTDRDGNVARLTANFVMANADLARMREEGFREFRWVEIQAGFPSPWSDSLIDLYRENIRKGIFEPGLHGFTHFNAEVLMDALHKDSECGRRAKTLVAHDVPYLASVTPEYNFALVTRDRRERFVSRRSQKLWVETGAKLFQQSFGVRPLTVCAPGYRSNSVTRKLWRASGVRSVQIMGTHGPRLVDGLVELPRNVSFEPALVERNVLDRTMEEIRLAASRRIPIIICSHSINYISRFLAAAVSSRNMLRKLLDRLLDEFPDVRFAGSAELGEAWLERRQDWFEPLSATEQSDRAARASG